MRTDDYQVIELFNDDLTLYQWDGKAWRYQRKRFATPEEELAFVAERGLVLVKQATLGVWPMRIYRVQ